MTKQFITFLMAFMLVVAVNAQEITPVQKFWNNLTQLCGKSFEGYLETPENDPQFSGKQLFMNVRSCTKTQIKIPFIVGNDRSRTWVFTLNDNRITLKHDHRHEDGSEDKITQYGGTTTNTGTANIQVFPADVATTNLIPQAASNVWWVTLNDNTFTYNLRRLGTNRVFTVVMDLSKTIETPPAPWGWQEN
jgi:hypothetical protein